MSLIKRLTISKKDEDVAASISPSPYLCEEDTTDYSGIVIDKPWGYEYSIFKNGEVDVWLLHINYRYKTSMHCHPHKKTSLLMLSGESRFFTLSETSKLGVGDGFLIGKGVFHATEASSPPGIFVLEAETPVNKKNLMRLDDLYGRSGKRYEVGMAVRARNQSLLRCFYESKHHLQEKSIGNSMFTMCVCKDNDEFQALLVSSQMHHSLVLLQGVILNIEGNVLHVPADIISLDVLMQNSRIEKKIEALLVRECK